VQVRETRDMHEKFLFKFQEENKRQRHRCANFINSFYNVIEMPKD
jgi:hypothetical protein